MRLIKWLIGIVITLALLLSVAPFAAKWYLVRWLQSQGYEAEIKQLYFNVLQGRLSTYGLTIVSPEGERLVIQEGSVDVDLLASLSGTKQLVIDQVSLENSEIGVQLSPKRIVILDSLWKRIWGWQKSPIPIELRTIKVTNSDVCLAREQCLRVEAFSVTRSHWASENGQWSWRHNGVLRLHKSFLRDLQNNTTLFYGGELEIKTGFYSAHKVRMEEVVMRNFQFIENSVGGGASQSPYQTQLGELTASYIGWANKPNYVLDLGKINVTSWRQSLQREESGELNVPSVLRRWWQELQQEPFSLKLEGLDLTDGAIAWSDRAVTPSASFQASAVSAVLTAINSDKTELPVAVKIAGRTGNSGKIGLEGDWYPFDEHPRFGLKVFAQNVELKDMVGYSRAYAGQEVSSGVMDFSWDAIARGGQINANTRWQFSQLNIVPSRSGGAIMTLDMSYKLLQDHNTSVVFSMPISGAAGSETLQPRYIFSRQMRRVMSDLARGHAQGGIAQSTSSDAQAEPFRNVEFQVNSRYPKGDSAAQLSRVAALLREKPHLRLTFCHVSTGGEWAEMFNQEALPSSITDEQKQTLLDLAAARSRIIQNQLVEAGAFRDQVVFCPPAIDLTHSGLSFVSISL